MSATAKAERGSPRQLAEPATRGREALRLRHESASDAMLAHPSRDEEAGDEKRGIDLPDAEMMGEIADAAPVRLRDQDGAERIARESKPGRASTIAYFIGTDTMGLGFLANQGLITGESFARFVLYLLPLLIGIAVGSHGFRGA
jgi:hypothetical protein